MGSYEYYNSSAFVYGVRRVPEITTGGVNSGLPWYCPARIFIEGGARHFYICILMEGLKCPNFRGYCEESRKNDLTKEYDLKVKYFRNA